MATADTTAAPARGAGMTRDERFVIVASSTGVGRKERTDRRETIAASTAETSSGPGVSCSVASIAFPLRGVQPASPIHQLGQPLPQCRGNRKQILPAKCFYLSFCFVRRTNTFAWPVGFTQKRSSRRRTFLRKAARLSCVAESIM